MKSWLSNTWIWLRTFFSEETGASMTRLLNIIWMIFLTFNLTFVMISNTIQTKTATLPPIEATSGYVIITTTLLAAKVGQKFLEK